MKAYYVTMRRETERHGVKTAWLLGPYETHEEALGMVNEGAALAKDAYPRCVWDAFGTASIDVPSYGTLNLFPEGRLTGAMLQTRRASA